MRLLYVVYALACLMAQPVRAEDEIKAGQIGLTQDLEVFVIQNPDVIQNDDMRLFYFGDKCFSRNGGEVKVLLTPQQYLAEGKVFVSYEWNKPGYSYKDNVSPGACPTKSIFLLEVGKFIEMRKAWEMREAIRGLLKPAS